MLIHIGGLTIGGRSEPLVITDLDDSGISYETSDVTIPNRAGVFLGRDTQSERTLTFTIRSNRSVRTLRAAQDLADQLTDVWASSAAKGPGELTEMIIETRDDRRRRVMGRCGKITAIVPDARAMQGGIELIAEFRWTDPIAYEAQDETFSISVVPRAQGGFKFPLSFPATTVSWGGVSYRFVENTGDAAAPMAVKFYGPCRNPKITVNGQEIAINAKFAYDDVITVDGRTGTVTNASGANVSRLLTRRTRLDSLRLAPGSHEVSFTSEDDTTTAHAEIVFASAHRNY